ncbi:hypothetical protein JYU16_01230 [bacterium AH-315-M05]|nr:hypothetical protein [bacterium AH-315-M05]
MNTRKHEHNKQHKTMEVQYYKISNIQPLPENTPNKGIFIVVLYANRIPPHLSLMINGKVFSLSVNGPKVNMGVDDLSKLIRSKSIETLFFQLKDQEDSTVLQLIEKMRELTLAYPGLDAGGATCLNPIKEFCLSVYKTDITGVNFIFDLLPKLGNVVIAHFHLNMESCLSDGVFYLEKYTIDDIDNMIRRLQPGKIPLTS